MVNMILPDPNGHVV